MPLTKHQKICSTTIEGKPWLIYAVPDADNDGQAVSIDHQEHRVYIAERCLGDPCKLIERIADTIDYLAEKARDEREATPPAPTAEPPHPAEALVVNEIKLTLAMAKTHCALCGIPFLMPSGHHAARQRGDLPIYCPNGHRMGWQKHLGGFVPKLIAQDEPEQIPAHHVHCCTCGDHMPEEQFARHAWEQHREYENHCPPSRWQRFVWWATRENPRPLRHDRRAA